MTKALRIGTLVNTDAPLADVVSELRRYAEAGLDHAFATQIFGPDALTALAVAGSQVPGLTLGTGVVPVHPRHPMVLAQQALTVQWATGNRLVLGIGLSHQVVVEGMWGLSYDKPASYMREYLAALLPLLRGETVTSAGEQVTMNAFVPLDVARLPGVEPPPVLVAALGPAMLRLAGTLADGTVTWMTGTKTIGEHVAPSITAAAAEAGRPAPRVVVSLPLAVTEDAEKAKARIAEAFAVYPNLPSYRAMLDREGAADATDIAFVGDEEAVAAAIGRLADAGATDFVAAVIGEGAERDRGLALLSDLARG
ncbi:MAG TPA: TIGR03564 family F420-dependent LLM class oxidoreductase [Acidimicrobiales bacterium]|nr:TIGR03564 family F420-dependent LLM class oxidoreductase [Acidimicrobiales bacterium]